MEKKIIEFFVKCDINKNPLLKSVCNIIFTKYNNSYIKKILSTEYTDECNEINEVVDLRDYTDPKIIELSLHPNEIQGSDEWLEGRNKYITASTILSVCSPTAKKARYNILAEKVSNGKFRSFRGNKATFWGNKYEAVANNIYKYKNNVRILEFGIIPSNKYPFLGVSPDGVVLDKNKCANKLIEIKCPFSRTIDGTIKKEYSAQIQMQLECCEFDECDFVECEFNHISEDDFYDNTYEFKGIIITYTKYENARHQLKHIYSPINVQNNDIYYMRKWESNIIDKILDQCTYGSSIYLSTSYWKLNIYNCQIVKKNPSWIDNNIKNIQDFWDEITYFRNNGGIDALNKKYESII
jgi:putative phage-type endonuclease